MTPDARAFYGYRMMAAYYTTQSFEWKPGDRMVCVRLCLSGERTQYIAPQRAGVDAAFLILAEYARG